ncbi:MAG TPA: hypothetical protein EYF96_04030 [Nitrospinaceae bacterium]|nr:hypothetical protein [Nitrospinaceae bacterium]
MENRYKWPPFISPEVKDRVKKEIGHITEHNLVRCDCESLSIRIHTYALDTRFKAELRCKCGTADQWGVLEGEIPETEVNVRGLEERRPGEQLRSAIGRRKFMDPNVPSTRCGKERRSR